MNRLFVMLIAVAVLAGVAMAHTAWEKSGDDYLEFLREVSVEHVVMPKETLWDIAKNYHPERDPREVIYYVRKINGLEGPRGPMLQVGQRVRVPVEF
jgi:hypothetical protein